MCNKYNGYTNKPTWTIALWLTNDLYTEIQFRGLLETHTDDFSAAGVLQDWIEDENPLAEQATMYSDIMTWALAQVNWLEIVRNFREE